MSAADITPPSGGVRKSPQINETFIRRDLNVPAGTPEQRFAWAQATPGATYLRILWVEPASAHVWAMITNGRPAKMAEFDLACNWERP